MKKLALFLSLICLCCLLAACPAPHTHTPADPVRENERAASCLSEGGYDSVVYCTGCSEELSRTPVVAEAQKPHTPAVPVRENEIPATCAAKGGYDTVTYCKDCSEELDRTATELETETVPDHTWEDGTCAACGAAQLGMRKLSDGTYMVSGLGKFKGTDVIVPAFYNGQPVVSIGGTAFYLRRSIRSVVISEGVSRIADYAFAESPAIERVSIPASVTKIGELAFSDTPLKTVTVAEGNPVYHAAGGCLIETESKTLVRACIGATIPTDGSVCIIGEGAFSNDDFIASITLPATVTKIGGSAFSGCTVLERVVIPEGVTEIGGSAFSGCYALTEITLPSSVQKIGPFAFSNCRALERIAIPEGVSAIEKQTFYLCTALQEVTVPESVTAIAPDVFNGCSALTRIAFADASGWYWTYRQGDTGGTLTDLSDPAENAAYFTYICRECYWYKK